MKVKIAFFIVNREQRSTIFEPVEVSQPEKEWLAVANIHFSQPFAIYGKKLPQFPLQTTDIMMDSPVGIGGEPPILILDMNQRVGAMGHRLGR